MNHFGEALLTVSDGRLYACFSKSSEWANGSTSTPSQASLDVSPSCAFMILFRIKGFIRSC
ncbi:hypothetical protein Hanom_Chr09g00790651 [Helianthus anomalus]